MEIDFGDGFFLRQATTADDAAICRVCLLTGDAGQDASAREDDPNLLGQIYCLPYRVLEPDLAFVVDSPDGVCGYLFGAADTAWFNDRAEREWYPKLRGALNDPGPDPSTWRGSDWARRMIHHPEPIAADVVADYPSHGHIDLLEQARGRGIGRKAMTLLMQRLSKAGSKGMFLDVHPQNLGARAFYAKLGFAPLPSTDLMVRRLPL
jgi:ribosomal protein S18 acetylase RimI-like enzyme